MKITPILFTPGNVRAIRDRSKTQTRRAMNPQPVRVSGGVPYRNPPPSLHGAPGSAIYHCPYGQRGDRLWVRETHYRYGRWVKNGKTVSGRQRWRFKPDAIQLAYYLGTVPKDDIGSKRGERRSAWWKRPSIFMPKWAARTWLEITEVRVQRLQEINEAGALAEGIERSGWEYSCEPYRNYAHPVMASGHNKSTARCSYMTLWESINGPGSWDINPWVWAITFKVVKA